jgi:hypothetical protein
MSIKTKIEIKILQHFVIKSNIFAIKSLTKSVIPAFQDQLLKQLYPSSKVARVDVREQFGEDIKRWKPPIINYKLEVGSKHDKVRSSVEVVHKCHLLESEIWYDHLNSVEFFFLHADRIGTFLPRCEPYIVSFSIRKKNSAGSLLRKK